MFSFKRLKIGYTVCCFVKAPVNEVFPEMFPRRANKEIFAEETNFASATNFSWGRNRGNICFGINVSETLFPPLQAPFSLLFVVAWV